MTHEEEAKLRECWWDYHAEEASYEDVENEYRKFLGEHPNYILLKRFLRSSSSDQLLRIFIEQRRLSRSYKEREYASERRQRRALAAAFWVAATGSSIMLLDAINGVTLIHVAAIIVAVGFFSIGCIVIAQHEMTATGQQEQAKKED